MADLLFTFLPVLLAQVLFSFFFLARCMACGILVLRPGIEPGPLAVKARESSAQDGQGIPPTAIFVTTRSHPFSD